jgi:hypothetical protein
VKKVSKAAKKLNEHPEDADRFEPRQLFQQTLSDVRVTSLDGRVTSSDGDPALLDGAIIFAQQNGEGGSGDNNNSSKKLSDVVRRPSNDWQFVKK